MREIPDYHRREGKRFDLSTVLLYAIHAMVAGAKLRMTDFVYDRPNGEILRIARFLETLPSSVRHATLYGYRPRACRRRLGNIS